MVLWPARRLGDLAFGLSKKGESLGNWWLAAPQPIDEGDGETGAPTPQQNQNSNVRL
jgi:hypothetical protein